MESTDWAAQRLRVLTPAAGGATFVLEVLSDGEGVRFTRWHDGMQDASYSVVPLAKAAVYAAAIVNGYLPPRDLRPFDTPFV